MSIQTDITPQMRSIVINWLIEVKIYLFFFQFIFMHLSFLAFGVVFPAISIRLPAFIFFMLSSVPLWLQVHFKFELMQETLYLMVTLLDRYLSQVQIEKKEIQLVGLTALLLASKYEDFWHPRVKINVSGLPGFCIFS